MNTSLVMIFSMISPQAKERFPELDNLVEAGFLVPHEKYIIDHLNEISDGPKYYVRSLVLRKLTYIHFMS